MLQIKTDYEANVSKGHAHKGTLELLAARNKLVNLVITSQFSTIKQLRTKKILI